MNRFWIAPLLLVMALLAGCAGDEGGDPGDAPDGPLAEGNQTAPPPGPVPVVTITNQSASVVVGEPVEVSWTVDADGNGTFAINETFLVWADVSVSAPTAATDYGNRTQAADAGEVPSSFNASFVPGELNGTRVYVRAYAVVAGVAAFSDEVEVEVAPAPPDVETHTVTIGSVGTGPVADYDPVVLRISVGEAVLWANEDTVAHTATDRDGAWTTGTVAGGTASALILFDAAGTFTYVCGIHATMIGGVIEVS